MLSVDVHKFKIEFTNAVRAGAFKNQVQTVRIVSLAHVQDIVVVGTSQDLSKAGDGYANAHRTVATVLLKAVSA